MSSSIVPIDLFSIVKEYTALGVHRTGTPVDEQTVRWFADHLTARGGRVSCPAYSFDRFDYQLDLRAGGEPVEALPLFYCHRDAIKTDRVMVAELTMDHADNGMDQAIADLSTKVSKEGYHALVLATMGETGALVAINQSPGDGGDIPVLLVAGRELARLRREKLSLNYEARVTPGQSANVIGQFGDSEQAARVVLTTPLSGWFTCAGERGTGIAIVLGLVEELASKMPMTVVGATGHELGMMGGYISAARQAPKPASVFHIGSCVAARGDAGLADHPQLTRDIDVTVGLGGITESAVLDALSPLGARVRKPDDPRDPACWIGESRCWAGKTEQMISVAGASPVFHTRDDTTERATTPALLARSYEAIRDAFLQFYR